MEASQSVLPQHKQEVSKLPSSTPGFTISHILSKPTKSPSASPTQPACSQEAPPPVDSSCSPKKTRKTRTAFSDYQLATLEKAFNRQKYLSVQDRTELAQKLCLTDTQVKTWYQNRRTKWKRQSAVGLELLGDSANVAAVQKALEGNSSWIHGLTCAQNLPNIGSLRGSGLQSTGFSPYRPGQSSALPWLLDPSVYTGQWRDVPRTPFSHTPSQAGSKTFTGAARDEHTPPVLPDPSDPIREQNVLNRSPSANTSGSSSQSCVSQTNPSELK